jgi:hypothetical protein
VRTLQRWFRRQECLRLQRRALAFMMATHKRLGADSALAVLDGDLVRMCVELH